MPTTLAFYRDILGFTVISSSWPGDDADWTWLRWHGIDLMFNTAYDKNERPGKPDLQRLAPHSDTSIYFGCPTIDTLYEYLSSKKVPVDEPHITKYGWKALVVKDPDNYLLIFHWPIKENDNK
jgi:catechol 2,3-dioxygenase-like lactoylglutathione lyase family enzyme